jgi:hypothetical protein
MEVKYSFPDNVYSVTRKLNELKPLREDPFCFRSIDILKGDIQPNIDIYQYLDVMWNDGNVGRSQYNKSLNWDNIVAWSPTNVI